MEAVRNRVKIIEKAMQAASARNRILLFGCSSIGSLYLFLGCLVNAIKTCKREECASTVIRCAKNLSSCCGNCLGIFLPLESEWFYWLFREYSGKGLKTIKLRDGNNKINQSFI
jgi:hypothetical protein